MLLTKEVEIKLNAKTISHYRNLGYIGNIGDIIVVKTCDLTFGSKADVEVLCDYCNQEVMTMQYKVYLNSLKTIKKSACKNCKGKKQTESNLLKYGVRNVTQLDEVKEKTRNTSMKKYGVSNYTKTKEYIQKRKETNLIRYGVENFSQTEDYKIKYRATCIDRYGEDFGKMFSERAINTFYERTGYEHPFQSTEVQNKSIKTCLEKYGVEKASQSLKIREKMNMTLCKNGTQKTSSQQLYLHILYGGEINYPVSYYATDICFPKEKLVIEYDGGGHDLRVILGKLTQEEFDHKEMVRDIVIKKEGYKIMKIKSSKDFLPSDKILLQMLEQTKQYFSDYPFHSWIEFNIDTSIVRNAEQKDGVFYDYGELRRIKKSDVKNINECVESA